MSEQPPEPQEKCVLSVSPNKFGIFSICGSAVESGAITEDNADEILERLIPVLEKVEDLLSEDLALPVSEGDLEALEAPNAYVYVPKGIEVNFTDFAMAPPTTEYEKNRVSFNRQALRQVTGGNDV